MQGKDGVCAWGRVLLLALAAVLLAAAVRVRLRERRDRARRRAAMLADYRVQLAELERQLRAFEEQAGEGPAGGPPRA